MNKKVTDLYDFSKIKVKCDGENNPPHIVDQKLLHIDLIVHSVFGKEYQSLIIPKDIPLYEEDYEDVYR